MSTQTTHWLDVVARILLRCWILGALVLMFWFGAVMLAGDLVYGVHAGLFDLRRHPKPALRTLASLRQAHLPKKL